MSPYLNLIFAWLVFAVIHSALAAPLSKRFAEKIFKGSTKYYRPVYSLIALITLLWVLHVHFSIGESVLWLSPWYQKVLAWVMVSGGLVVMALCIKKYFLYLSGIDVLLHKTPVARLEQIGMHAYVRHPLYAGTLLFVWGIFAAFPYLSNLISCVCITVYTLIGIQFEERKLLREYGEEYRRYRSRVPMLIPSLREDRSGR